MYGQTWKFSTAWTLKDVIVQDWIEDIRADTFHCPKPFYMDYMVVLDISCCTGHSGEPPYGISSSSRQQNCAITCGIFLILKRLIFLTPWWSSSPSGLLLLRFGISSGRRKEIDHECRSCSFEHIEKHWGWKRRTTASVGCYIQEPLRWVKIRSSLEIDCQR